MTRIWISQSDYTYFTSSFNIILFLQKCLPIESNMCVIRLSRGPKYLNIENIIHDVKSRKVHSVTRFRI